MRVEYITSEPIRLAAGCEASRTICGVVLVDAGTRQGYFGAIRTGVIMNSSLAGLIIGSLIGVVFTLLVLMIIAGAKGPENAPAGSFRTEKFFW